MTLKPLRHLGIIGAGVALAALLSGCQTSEPANPGDQSAIVGLTFIPNIQFAPFYVADDAGFYVDDMDITLRHHGAQEGLFTALAAGEEDFVVAGGDEILQARTQGIDVVAVGSYYGRYPVRIIVPEGSDITKVADLKGRNVGLPGEFGENWFALLIALDEAGLTTEDLTITSIGYTGQAALMEGHIDAAVGFANSDVLAYERMGFAVRAIDPEVPLVSICLGTTSAYAQAHPDIVAAVIEAMKQGMVTSIEDEEKTLQIAGNYIPSFRDEVLATARVILPATTALFQGGDGTVSPPLDPAGWTAMARALESVGLIPEGTDVTSAYSTDFSR